MSKFMRVLLAVLIITAVGYAFAFKSGRIRNHFGNASDYSNDARASMLMHACTQLGAVKNQSAEKKTISFTTKGSSMHVKVESFPARLEPGMQGQYQVLLPCEEDSGNDKITVDVNSGSGTVCTYTVISDGDGGAKISSTDTSMCSWSSTGDLVIGGEESSSS